MSGSSVGTANEAVPTPSGDSLDRAFEMCDRALDILDELQRADTVDPNHLQAAVAAVQAVRTELAQTRS
jgi:predicted RNA polymerase sigma factor